MAGTAEFEKCRRCGSEEFYRSHSRNSRERLFRLLLPIHYCRCHSCGWRGARVSGDSWRGWKSRLKNRVLPVVIALLLLGAIAYLASESTRQVFEKPAPARKK